MLQVTNRKLGGAEPEHGLAGKVLELGEGALHIRFKSGRLHAKNTFMAIGMAPDLVTAPRPSAPVPAVLLPSLSQGGANAALVLTKE